MSPQRIQLRRTRGWRLPAGAVVVARPTRWGNPIKVGTPVVDQDTGVTRVITAEEAVATYRAALLSGRLGMYGGAEITVDAVRGAATVAGALLEDDGEVFGCGPHACRIPGASDGEDAA
ncbi:MAG TPA: DUF4326 domain-containing protein [Kineosporiaceae bacterium]